MILLVKSPLFESVTASMIFCAPYKHVNGKSKKTEKGKLQLSTGTKLVMVTYLTLLTVIQWVILTNISGTCDIGIDENGEWTECILNYDAVVIILAIVHVIFDSAGLLIILCTI